MCTTFQPKKISLEKESGIETGEKNTPQGFVKKHETIQIKHDDLFRIKTKASPSGAQQQCSWWTVEWMAGDWEQIVAGIARFEI